MSKYTPFYSRKFSTNLQHYAAMRQPIKRRVERILQAPYHNTEALADSSRGVNLVGCRSARVDRNFRIVFVICEECRQILACEYCQCDDLADQTVVFLTVGPHDRAYTME